MTNNTAAALAALEVKAKGQLSPGFKSYAFASDTVNGKTVSAYAIIANSHRGNRDAKRITWQVNGQPVTKAKLIATVEA